MGHDGGPAFPRITGVEAHAYGAQSVVGAPGMSLRDFYSGLALMGIIITPDWTNRDGKRPTTDDELADAALDMAETMINRRALRGW